jgi:hypothetical protein
MPRSTAISSILVLAAAMIAACSEAAPPPAPSPSPRTVLVPQVAPPEVQAEYLRLERIAADWARQLREQHGLRDAQCRIALEPGERTGCSFEMDGVSLHVMKTGRSPSTNLEALFSFGNLVDMSAGRIDVVGGTWIRVGDVFELEAGPAVYAHFCEQIGEADYAFAQCRWGRDHAEIAARATRPPAAYDFEAREAQPNLGAALRAGTIRVLHNGSVVDIAPLIAATRQFAREDFAQLARR